jgi:hypothetical protein
MDFHHAHQDIMSALELTPDTIELIDLRSEIEHKLDNNRKRKIEEANSKILLSQASVHQIGQFSDSHEFVSDTHSNVIAKLRSSLGSDHAQFSSSESDSENSESDRQSFTSDEDGKTKRRKKSSDSGSKHGKRKKSDKKKHKEKKKSKRKSKKHRKNDH